MATDIKDALPIGTSLNSGKRTYRIEAILGAGGFGITYKVSSEIMVDNVPIITYFALKEHFVKKACERKDSKVFSSANNAQDVQNSKINFLSEAVRLNKISASHNNIVRVNENFTANDTAYYVMEYIDGKSLREVIKERGGKPLDWDTIWNLIQPIANAVAYLHDNRLTHLDIKPDNIILDKKKGNRPVLIDFGLSKHYDKNGQPTSTVKVAGCSDGYSPIEQYVGLTSFSPKADIYALAATMLFLLTGKDPRIASELKETTIREEIEGKVPAHVLSALLHALRFQREERTNSVVEFIKELNSIEPATGQYEKDPEPTVRITDPVPPKPKKPFKIILITLSVIVCIFLIGWGVYTFFSKPAVPEEAYIQLSDGSKFSGVADEQGKPDGTGILITAIGDTVKGSWINGELKEGTLIKPDFQYTGQLINLQPSGYGTASYKDGKIFTGHWLNGDWDGLGKLESSEGNLSFGIFRKGVLTNPQPFTIGNLVYGIDVSRYQRQIDWENLYLPASEEGKVTAAGGDYMQPVLFALLKATDGKDQDEYYERNYLNAKRCGITCGAYHFLTTLYSAEMQVENFIKTAHLEPGDLPPILDMELPNEVMKERRKEVCEIALEWLEKIEAYYGVKPIIYTYNYFIIDYLTDPRFDNYDYWVSRYRATPPEVNKWDFWQFTDKAKVPGIKASTVDVDIFNGSLSEFRKYINRNGIKQ